jgi:hypothetical protein
MNRRQMEAMIDTLKLRVEGLDSRVQGIVEREPKKQRLFWYITDGDKGGLRWEVRRALDLSGAMAATGEAISIADARRQIAEAIRRQQILASIPNNAFRGQYDIEVQR